jgi:hypothetical protein
VQPLTGPDQPRIGRSDRSQRRGKAYSGLAAPEEAVVAVAGVGAVEEVAGVAAVEEVAGVAVEQADQSQQRYSGIEPRPR